MSKKDGTNALLAITRHFAVIARYIVISPL